MNKSPEAFRTISEVAEQLDVPAHVLRFWESRFAQVKPVKRGGGRRYYRPDDVRLLRGIRGLLYEDGMTIKGVQKILREQGVRHVIELGSHGDAPAAPCDLREAATSRKPPAEAKPAADPDGAAKPAAAEPDGAGEPAAAAPQAAAEPAVAVLAAAGGRGDGGEPAAAAEAAPGGLDRAAPPSAEGAFGGPDEEAASVAPPDRARVRDKAGLRALVDALEALRASMVAGA
jgi:DNA-binding transcriptional MerR regulator